MFADESGFSLTPTVRRTWAPKGQTPVIRHPFNWKRLHAVGAIACKPDGTAAQLHMQVQPIATNSETTVSFIDSLHETFKGDIVLLWDGLPAHRSIRVREHAEQQDWLTVIRLPAYAPELNPVEYLWSALKTKHTANVSDNSIDELTARIERAYNHYEREQQTLGGFLRASSLYQASTDQIQDT